MPLGVAASAQREHPQGPTLGAAPDPARGWKAGAGRGAGIREQVRQLGCLTPHNQRIVTPRLQPGAMGCRHPRAVPLAFGDSEQFVGLARFAVVDAFQRRLPGRCGVPTRNSSRPPPLLPPRQD